jgi:hypothetical protein
MNRAPSRFASADGFGETAHTMLMGASYVPCSHRSFVRVLMRSQLIGWPGTARSPSTPPNCSTTWRTVSSYSRMNTATRPRASIDNT